MDDEVKLRKIFGPLDLASSEELGCGKIFQVFVVGSNINWLRGAFEIVVPRLECFEDRQQFFVMDIIIQLWRSEGLRVKGNWVDVIVYWGNGGQNSSKHIV